MCHDPISLVNLIFVICLHFFLVLFKNIPFFVLFCTFAFYIFNCFDGLFYKTKAFSFFFHFHIFLFHKRSKGSLKRYVMLFLAKIWPSLLPCNGPQRLQYAPSHCYVTKSLTPHPLLIENTGNNLRYVSKRCFNTQLI